MKKIFGILIVLVFLVPAQTNAAVTAATYNTYQHININSDDEQSDAGVFETVMSKDGRYIVFTSTSTNLSDTYTGTEAKVFVYDRQLDSLEVVSVNDSGTIANNASQKTSITDDGRYVSFISTATNLVTPDTNGRADLFVYDRTNDTIELIPTSTSPDNDIPILSSDGTYIFYTAVNSGTSYRNIYRYNRDTDTTTNLTASANNHVSLTSTSEDARYVVFDTTATNIVAGDTNSVSDVFVYDTQEETFERMSVNSSEVQGNGASVNGAISPDGLFITFESAATNLDTETDENGEYDVFVRDISAGTTELISITDAGVTGDLGSYSVGISSGGRYVMFSSEATDIYEGTEGQNNLFIKDRTTGDYEIISLTEEYDISGGSHNTNALSMSETSRYFLNIVSGTDMLPGGASDTNSGQDLLFIELLDSDGISSSIEDAAPNSGDADDDGYDDAIENNTTSFVNSVTGNYTTVDTTGNCTTNSNVSAAAESSLGTQDAEYDYPLGVVDFTVNCDDTGESATVSIYCFCEDTELEGLVARKYDSNTGLYTTIEDATLSEVTIGGSRALKMVYTVTDGGELDEDGLENGVISDPVGFGQPVVVEPELSSPSSSVSSTVYGCKDPLAINYQTFVMHNVSLCKYNSEKIAMNDTKIQNISCTPFTTLMKLGSKQGEVSKLQQTLNTLGFNTGPVDGWFGNLTNAGVKAFQASQNIDADGIVGPVTRGKLNGFCN